MRDGGTVALYEPEPRDAQKVHVPAIAGWTHDQARRRRKPVGPAF